MIVAADIEIRKLVIAVERLSHILKSQTSAIAAQTAVLRTLAEQQAVMIQQKKEPTGE